MINKAFSYIIVLAAALLAAACSQPRPTPFPTMTMPSTPLPSPTQRPTETPTPVPLETFEIEEGALTVDLPRNWEVAEKGLTTMGSYYQVGPPPLGPGPASSSLFVANALELTPAEAAELLLCGGGCAEDVMLQEATVGGRPAAQATIGDPALEWFFVEAFDRLIYFTLHDPDSLVTRHDLVESLRIGEQVAGLVPDATIAPTATAQPTSTPTPMPSPTPLPTPASYELEDVRQWDVVEVASAELAYNVPSEWEPSASGRQWSPPEAPDLLIGFEWTQTAQGAEPALSPPDEATVANMEPFSPTWTVNPQWTTAISGTIGAHPLWEQHIVVQVGLRQYDFLSRGPASTALPALRPFLLEMVSSATVGDALIYVDDPLDGAVEWFRALLRDSSGREARPYMSQGLQDSIPEGESALNLLELPSPISTFNLAGVGAPGSTYEVEATLELFNGETVTRTLVTAFDEATGWHIDAVGVE